jgi:Xaa-Pro aminopeptidase
MMDTVVKKSNGHTLALDRTERDRRWAAARAMMAKQGLDALVVFSGSRDNYDAWFTNEIAEGVVIFPVKGEPVYVSWHFKMISRRFGSSYQDEDWWVNNFRVAPNGEGIVRALQEFGVESGRIGTIGVDTKEPAAIEGFAAYNTWTHVLQKLPKATFADVTYPLGEVMMVKSPAEIALARRCGEIGELACKAFIDAARPGAPESDLQLAVTRAILEAGGTEINEIIETIGRDDIGWARPQVNYTNKPRIMQPGDLIMAEIFPRFGGVETQQQMAITLGTPEDKVRELFDVARESYDHGLEVIKPGAMFSDVCKVMLRPIEERGLWNLTPMIHSVNPLLWVCPMAKTEDLTRHLPRLRAYGVLPKATVSTIDLEIKPGMMFALEPNACRGQLRVNIGGSVMVTEDGIEELNELANHLHVVN